MASARPYAPRMLGMRFCENTHLWVAENGATVSAEVMAPLLQPGATALDLLYVLIVRDGEKPQTIYPKASP
jgi:hypothetical protein